MFAMSHDYCSNSMKKSNSRNQINSSGVGDDNVYQLRTPPTDNTMSIRLCEN
jgi:hypothetical protein